MVGIALKDRVDLISIIVPLEVVAKIVSIIMFVLLDNLTGSCSIFKAKLFEPH